MSKFNFSLRKSYLIKDALLEKQLLYNYSIIIMKKSTHVITDLAAYYDRQLSHIKSMIMESVGINQQFVILMARLLQVLQYFTCAGYGISTESYGNETEIYAGTG